MQSLLTQGTSSMDSVNISQSWPLAEMWRLGPQPGPERPPLGREGTESLSSGGAHGCRCSAQRERTCPRSTKHSAQQDHLATHQAGKTGLDGANFSAFDRLVCVLLFRLYFEKHP